MNDASSAPARDLAAPLRGDEVYRALRQAIIDQALPPGDRLPEENVGRRFGVSRTIVRHALQRLAAEGLVDLTPYRRATVAAPGLEEARDVFEMRQCLEREVVLRAAQGPADAFAALDRHVRREDLAHGKDGPESIRLAGEFHLLLADLTGNQVLRRYVGEIVSRCSLILACHGRPHSSQCAVDEHRRLIEALRRGDRDSATRTMRDHLDAVMARALIGAG